MRFVGINMLATIKRIESWDREKAYDFIAADYIQTMEQIKEVIGDITKLSIADLKVLGFEKWEEESDLYLVPLWIFNILPHGLVLTSIDGVERVKGKDEIDLTTRFGCIGWGIIPNECKKEEKVSEVKVISFSVDDKLVAEGKIIFNTGKEKKFAFQLPETMGEYSVKQIKEEVEDMVKNGL